MSFSVCNNMCWCILLLQCPSDKTNYGGLCCPTGQANNNKTCVAVVSPSWLEVGGMKPIMHACHNWILLPGHIRYCRLTAVLQHCCCSALNPRSIMMERASLQWVFHGTLLWTQDVLILMIHNLLLQCPSGKTSYGGLCCPTGQVNNNGTCVAVVSFCTQSQILQAQADRCVAAVPWTQGQQWRHMPVFSESCVALLIRALLDSELAWQASWLLFVLKSEWLCPLECFRWTGRVANLSLLFCSRAIKAVMISLG